MIKSRLSLLSASVVLITSLNLGCMEQTQTYTPENTKFAFDFHDVVAKARPNYIRIVDGLCTWDMVPELNWELPAKTLNCLYNFPWVAYSTAQLMYNKGTGEQYYHLYNQYGFAQLAKAVMSIANDLNFIDGTVAIIKELKDKGYHVDMASDIGSSFLADLEKRKKFNEVLNLFINKKSVDYINTVNPIHKPNIQFFTDYQTNYNTAQMTIIFVDDKQKNVLASEKAGMSGIQFKSPEQLRAELVNRKILEKK